MSSCFRCHAVIKFVTMEETRKNVPVEPIPHPEGTVAARLLKPVAYGMHPRLFGYVVSRARPLEDGYSLYMAHHKECDRIATPTAPKPKPEPTLFDLDPTQGENTA